MPSKSRRRQVKRRRQLFETVCARAFVELTTELRREPTSAELARFLDIDTARVDAVWSANRLRQARRPIQHRDISPSNIFVGDPEQPPPYALNMDHVDQIAGAVRPLTRAGLLFRHVEWYEQTLGDVLLGQDLDEGRLGAERVLLMTTMIDNITRKAA